MDHMNLPQQSKYPHISIPYLVVDQFSGDDFETYPARNGWTDADIQGTDPDSKSKDQRAAFLQSWLFFGLLRTVFNSRYAENQWIDSSDPQRPVVSLVCLEERLKHLFPRNSHLSQAGISFSILQTGDEEQSLVQPSTLMKDNSVHLEQIAAPLDTSKLSEVLTYAHDWNIRLMGSGIHNHALDLVCLSIAALGEFLCSYFGILDEERWLRSSKTNFLFERMLDDGWCPVEIIRLNSIAGLPEIYFSSNLDRPGPTRSHQSCRERIPVERMDSPASFISQLGEDWKCTAYDMDWETYQTEHVPGCNECDELPVNQSQTQQILESGFFPLLRPASTGSKTENPTARGIDDNDRHKPTDELPLTSTEMYEKYVCISHVWSDGLGNPHANSIPRCQYERLSAMTDRLYPSLKMPFWIDTICVPREPLALRRQTIMLMRKTYRDADMVLILDKYLLGVDLDESSEREVWVRILNCGWMRRLWTLQECTLARKAWFQLRNGTLDLDRALTFDIDTNDTWTLQWLKLRGSWRRGGIHLENQQQKMLGVLSDALAWRATSIAEDEAVCLGIITDLDSAEIGQIIALESHEDRMMKFWRLTKILSSEILFWDGPRLSQQGQRWAPSSFLNKGPTPFLGQQSNTYQSAQLRDQGLRVKLSGLQLGMWRRRFRATVFLRLSSTSWYRLVSNMDELPCPPELADARLAAILQEPDLSFVDSLPPGGSMAVLVVLIRPSPIENSGVILAEPKCVGTIERAERFGGWVNPLEQLRSRFYAKASTQLDKFKTLEIDGTVLGHFNSDSTLNSDLKAFWSDGHLSFDLEDKHLMIEVSQTPEHQEWCVG